MNYLELNFEGTNEALNAILLANLSPYAFNGFEEKDKSLVAYIDASAYEPAIAETVQNLVTAHGLNLQTNQIQEQNWNAQWEADYEPVLVDDFCAVRATFHEPITTVQHEIIVTPKMSFGTGHHATTYMMMRQMEALSLAGTTVFDYGCGTGVLAILAHKLGATAIDAIDIDHWAYENSLENAKLNNCEKVLQVGCGTLADHPQKKYDLILANINRNVLLDTMAGMAARLKKGGTLLLSGFLEADKPLIIAAAAKEQLRPVNTLERLQWRCMRLEY